MALCDGLADRVRGEYREMPGLALTVEQAARLWATNVSTCETVLQELVVRGVLYRNSKGAYVAAPSTAETKVALSCK